MATSEFCSSISCQFPHPCRPFHASIEPVVREDETCDTFINFEEYAMLYKSEEENNISADNDEGEQDEEGESRKLLTSFLEKLDEQGRIMHKKLHFKLRRDGTIDRKFRETLHDFKERLVSDLFENSSRSGPDASSDHKNTERGIDVGMEEPKLERFKVKTVNIAGVGVVKEED